MGDFNGGRYMVPDLGSSRGESTTSKIGFCRGNVQERLTRGTERTTELMVGYEIMKCVVYMTFSRDVILTKNFHGHIDRLYCNRVNSEILI